MEPRFRHGEVVRVVAAPGGGCAPGAEGVVMDVAGPNEDGTCWTVTLRVADKGGGDSLLLLSETELEPTGFTQDDQGERVALADSPPPEDRRDCLELRLFTEIADGIDAARVAEMIEGELVELLGGATVSTEAERHWSEPYNYELAVTIYPLDDPADALRLLTEAGGGGWLSCRDDGWRCDLWWSDGSDEDTVLLVPEVHGAELAYLPWRSPRRRPDAERPLVAISAAEYLDPEPNGDRLDGELDPEPGDEEP